MAILVTTQFSSGPTSPSSSVATLYNWWEGGREGGREGKEGGREGREGGKEGGNSIKVSRSATWLLDYTSYHKQSQLLM